MGILEDGAEEILRERGVLPISILMMKLKITYEKAVELQEKFTKPIKKLDPKRVEKFKGPHMDKFWKSRKDWIV